MSDENDSDSSHPTSYNDCLRQLETMQWKYNLPPDVEVRIDDIVDLGKNSSRLETADRVTELISYFSNNNPHHNKKKQIIDYLNGVITSLYGNEK